MDPNFLNPNFLDPNFIEPNFKETNILITIIFVKIIFLIIIKKFYLRLNLDVSTTIFTSHQKNLVILPTKF